MKKYICGKEPVELNNEHQLLNDVYREIADNLGIEAAETIYNMFRGQQISFPLRFLRSDKVREMIREEYDGTNAKALAKKYEYSEKTIRRIIKNSESEKEEN